MKRVKAVLFDADGVLTVPESLFAQIYAAEHDFNPKSFEQFFEDKFPDALVGRADLKQLIAENNDIWRWDGEVEDLLKLWFETENVQNEALLNYIAKLRNQGILCYVVTNQEKYRGKYMQDVMFKGKFDGFFISAEIGAKKPSTDFFKKVIEAICGKNPSLKPEDIIYFDDTQKHVDAGKRLGLDAHLYKNVEQVNDIIKPI
ncbi:hypothetical protein A3F37_03045 [Candidatus Saccharibacteria bacterium RIFCSPHIGHO2_12_FULL_41_12]|nr:MAG: hypothetical protein A3F37_03045 [Candidatus Saccharibacteria bacterium RIFCSPHIGHO2_12_FULL_41_12]